ncbi:potassium voltage-gated channel Eag-related subfamily H member 3 [Sarotherodon galilaeus]
MCCTSVSPSIFDFSLMSVISSYISAARYSAAVFLSFAPAVVRRRVSASAVQYSASKFCGFTSGRGTSGEDGRGGGVRRGEPDGEGSVGSQNGGGLDGGWDKGLGLGLWVGDGGWDKGLGLGLWVGDWDGGKEIGWGSSCVCLRLNVPSVGSFPSIGSSPCCGPVSARRGCGYGGGG